MARCKPCAATAAKPGPRAIYLGGFHRPTAPLRQQNPALAPFISGTSDSDHSRRSDHDRRDHRQLHPRAHTILNSTYDAPPKFQQMADAIPAATIAAVDRHLAHLGLYPRSDSAGLAPVAPLPYSTLLHCSPWLRPPRRFSPPPLRRSGGKRQPLPRPILRLVSPMLHCSPWLRPSWRFSPLPMRHSGGQRQPLPRPISRLVSPMLHCSPWLRPPRVLTPPVALGASKPTVALTPSKASYTANLSLPCPLSLFVSSPPQVYHVYTEDPHVYTKVSPLMPNLPLSSLLSPAYSGSPVLLPLSIASSGPLCLRLRLYCTPRRLYLRSRQMHLGPRRL